MRDLKLTLVQPDMRWQNPAANYQLFDTMLADGGHAADLIILPEMFTTGFTMNAAEHAEDPDGPSTTWLKEMADKYQAHICGSLIVRDANRYFNRLIWADPDGIIQSYDKRHLFRMADEQDHYAAGNERLIVNIGEWRICPLVCYDLRFPVWSRNHNDYDLLLYVANWPAPRRSAWRTLLPARAVENLCYAAGVNRVGTDGNDVNYAGDSMVADYLGALSVDAENNAGTFSTTLSLDKLERYRHKFPAWKDADNFTLVDSSD
jgi:omega-amidase